MVGLKGLCHLKMGNAQISAYFDVAISFQLPVSQQKQLH